jgi:hypothetical protein
MARHVSGRGERWVKTVPAPMGHDVPPRQQPVRRSQRRVHEIVAVDRGAPRQQRVSPCLPFFLALVLTRDVARALYRLPIVVAELLQCLVPATQLRPDCEDRAYGAETR